ncbi:MAG: hypothetical protein H7833_06055 [Magnetococcus sp. DMHC-1]
MDVGMPFQIVARGMEDSRHRRKKSLLFAEGYEGFQASSKNSVQKLALLKQQRHELGRNRKGDKEIGAIRKHLVHVGNPFVHWDLGADRTETAFAESENVAQSPKVVGTGGRGVAKIRLPAVHDHPNIISSVPSDQRVVDGKKGISVFQKELFDLEPPSVDGIHDGPGLYPIRWSRQKNCSKGASRSRHRADMGE